MKKIAFIIKSICDFAKYLIVFPIFSLHKQTDFWLISERGNDARDNGYWFYKFLKESHPEINVKYVITKNSPDASKISKDDIVKYRSIEHYYRLFTSKYLISAEIMGFTPNERLHYRLNKKGILKLRGKTIFLQHGITKDYFDYLKKENTKLDLFICGAKREYDFMLKKYKYNKQNVALTGFARFDQLKDSDDKIILIIPTWRKWLRYNSTLRGTEFFESYEKLLNDKEIIDAAKKNDYKIVFYPHPDMQKFIDDFYVTNKKVCRIASAKTDDMQSLFKRASILITDYSSVAFDVAYMGKKTIYYQFDKENYRAQQYSEGYYSYEKDGFGPIASNFDEIKSNVISFMNDKKKFNKYNDRIADFFGTRSTENCKNIYNAIINMSLESEK